MRSLSGSNDHTAASSRSRRVTPRRGLALVIVMAAIAACLVVAVAFLHSQQGSLRMMANLRSADRAAEAAQCGMAAALSDLQSPTWDNLATVLARQVGSDASGVWSYQVTLSPVAGDGTAEGALAAAMKLKVTSVGTFLATGNPRPVERTMEAVLQLVPRTPVSLAASPSDRKPDATFDPMQQYAVLADGGGDSLKLPPQAKIVGNVWVNDNAKVYGELNWSASVRARAGASAPQPVTGVISLYKTAKAGDAANLTALLGSGGWAQTSTLLTLPTLTPAQFSPAQSYNVYEIYDNGPDHRAVTVAGTLDGTTSNPVVLGPTDSNPLGIFFRTGDVVFKDNVRVTGTVVATGKIVFEGPGVEIAAVKPPSAGASVSMPAVIVGTEVEIKKEASVSITGLVYAPTQVTREEVDRQSGTSVTVTGAIMTAKLDLGTPPMWKALSSSHWDTQSGNCPSGTPFLPWLANTSNWPLLYWGLTYATYGLSNEPSFTVTRPADAVYTTKPPLYRPDPSAWSAGGGYRWAVVSWGEPL